MRQVTFLIVIAFSAALHAQRGRPVAPPPPPPPSTFPVSPIPLPLPTTFPASTPPPPSTFPVSPLITPPAGGLTIPFRPAVNVPPRDLFRVRPGNRVYTRTRGVFPVFGGGGYIDGVPQLGVAGSDAAPELQPPATLTGMLRLSVTPPTASVFIDSYYVGTVADVEAERVLVLPAGPHRVELRAPDHVPVTVDIRIAPNDTITYRATLDRVAPPAPPRTTPAAGPTRMYVIPKCYLGNVPPKESRLPRGCNIKQLQVIS